MTIPAALLAMTAVPELWRRRLVWTTAAAVLGSMAVIASQSFRSQPLGEMGWLRMSPAGRGGRRGTRVVRRDRGRLDALAAYSGTIERMAHHDLIIIGTGSGNSIADKSLRHLDIGIVEESTFGGTCSNVGCIPTKMLVYAAELAQRTEDSARFGIDAHVDKVRWPDIRDRIFGRLDPMSESGRDYREHGPNTTLYSEHVEFVGPRRLRLASGTELTADQIVIAAGGRPIIPDDRRSRRHPERAQCTPPTP